MKIIDHILERFHASGQVPQQIVVLIPVVDQPEAS
jgi:hypothetical protein